MGVFDSDGFMPSLELARDCFPRLSHPWLDAGYDGKGKGKDRVEKALGLTAEVVRPPRRWMWVPARDEDPKSREKRYRENRPVCGDFARPGTLPKSV